MAVSRAPTPTTDVQSVCILEVLATRCAQPDNILTVTWGSLKRWCCKSALPHSLERIQMWFERGREWRGRGRGRRRGTVLAGNGKNQMLCQRSLIAGTAQATMASAQCRRGWRLHGTVLMRVNFVAIKQDRASLPGKRHGRSAGSRRPYPVHICLCDLWSAVVQRVSWAVMDQDRWGPGARCGSAGYALQAGCGTRADWRGIACMYVTGHEEC